MALNFDDIDDKIKNKELQEHLILAKVESYFEKYNEEVLGYYYEKVPDLNRKDFIPVLKRYTTRKGYFTKIRNFIKKYFYELNLDLKMNSQYNYFGSEDIEIQIKTYSHFLFGENTIMYYTVYFSKDNKEYVNLIQYDNMVRTFFKHILWYQWYNKEQIKYNDYYLSINTKIGKFQNDIQYPKTFSYRSLKNP